MVLVLVLARPGLAERGKICGGYCTFICRDATRSHELGDLWGFFFDGIGDLWLSLSTSD